MRGTKKIRRRRILLRGKSKRGGRKLRSGARIKRREPRGRRELMSWSSLCLTMRCSLFLDKPLMKIRMEKARRTKTRRKRKRKRGCLSTKQFKLKGKSCPCTLTKRSSFKL